MILWWACLYPTKQGTWGKLHACPTTVLDYPLQGMQCMNGWAYSQIFKFLGSHQLLEGLTALSEGPLSWSNSVTMWETCSTTKAILKGWTNLQEDQWISQGLKICSESLQSLRSLKITKFKKCPSVPSPAQYVPKPMPIESCLWQAQELIYTCSCLALHLSIFSPLPVYYYYLQIIKSWLQRKQVYRV